MGLLSFWNKKTDTEPITWLTWGRYTDIHKSQEQYDAWDQAQICFSDQEWIPALKHLTVYLQNPSGDNMEWEEDGSVVRISFIQGSTIIRVAAHDDHIKAHVDMVGTEDLILPLMRRLLEVNYRLKYCRYAVQGKHTVQLIFDSPWDDMDAYKFYYALKELALQADSQDDLFAGEWEQVNLVDTEHIQAYNESTSNHLVQFSKQKVRELQNYLESDLDDKLKAYAILSQLYLLDYLVRPQGKAAQKIHFIQHVYFSNPGQWDEGHRKSMKEISEWSQWDDEKWRSELYRTSSTFAMVEPCSASTIQQIIRAEWEMALWYAGERRYNAAEDVVAFVIGYTLYHYAPPKEIRKLYEIVYWLAEPQFFEFYGYAMPDDGFFELKKRLLDTIPEEDREKVQAFKAKNRWEWIKWLMEYILHKEW